MYLDRVRSCYCKTIVGRCLGHRCLLTTCVYNTSVRKKISGSLLRRCMHGENASPSMSCASPQALWPPTISRWACASAAVGPRRAATKLALPQRDAWSGRGVWCADVCPGKVWLDLLPLLAVQGAHWPCVATHWATVDPRRELRTVV
jgi:hypothetical protein